MLTVKPDTYYFDKNRRLLYVMNKAVLGGTYVAKYLWEVQCLTTNSKLRLADEELNEMLVQDLGSTIAPAIRLLYGAVNV